MRFLSLTITIFLLSTNLLIAQQWDQVYSTGFDIGSENEQWTLYELGAVNDFYHWSFSQTNAHSEPSCLLHWYPVGGTEITDNWFVSPIIDFNGGARIDSVWALYEGFGLPYNEDTIALYAISGNQDPSLADNVQLVHLFTDETYNNDGVWRKYENIEVPNFAGNGYFAFRYKTIVNWLDVKFDDLYISRQNIVGLEENNLANNIQLINNPVENEIRLNYNDNGELIKANLFNTKGQSLLTFSFESNTSIDVAHLSKGIYFLSLQTDSEQGTIKMLKQ